MAPMDVTPYAKTVVCFANSRKYGGWCVAGKEWRDSGPGDWVRPVSLQPNGELMDEDCRCSDGHAPRPLDVLKIRFQGPPAHSHQKENHLICSGRPWDKVGRLSWPDLAAWLDSPPSLWGAGDRSNAGISNRVAEGCAGGASLYLIPVDGVHLLVGPKSPGHEDARRGVRGEFRYKDNLYRLDVTDPFIERHLLARPDEVYFLENCVLCVSLGEPFQGHYYKLIAAILTQRRFQP